jgi:hypothetical protein
LQVGRPADVIASYGGLDVSVASTAFMSLKDATLYLSKPAICFSGFCVAIPKQGVLAELTCPEHVALLTFLPHTPLALHPVLPAAASCLLSLVLRFNLAQRSTNSTAPSRSRQN